MDQKLVIPKFTSEAEEAQWWFDNQDLAFEEFERAGKEGRLGRGIVAGLAHAATAELPLNPEDIDRARKQAAREGMEYQDYLKLVMHEALVGREKRA